jgi:hypothetical protein
MISLSTTLEIIQKSLPTEIRTSLRWLVNGVYVTTFLLCLGHPAPKSVG